jgi:hypothetical protein
MRTGRATVWHPACLVWQSACVTRAGHVGHNKAALLHRVSSLLRRGSQMQEPPLTHGGILHCISSLLRRGLQMQEPPPTHSVVNVLREKSQGGEPSTWEQGCRSKDAKVALKGTGKDNIFRRVRHIAPDTIK